MEKVKSIFNENETLIAFLTAVVIAGVIVLLVV